MYRRADSMPLAGCNRCGAVTVFQVISNNFDQGGFLINPGYGFVVAKVEQHHIRVRFFQIYILFQNKVLAAYNNPIVGILQFTDIKILL